MITRFHIAQSSNYKQALHEIKNSRKKSHWMWFIFPQLKGLGVSDYAQYYSIDGIDEAKEYLADDILNSRLNEISNALLELETNDALAVLGYPDNLKLKSCMTLFSIVDNKNPIFKAVLDKFFNGENDEKTVKLLKRYDHIISLTHHVGNDTLDNMLRLAVHVIIGNKK